MAENTFIKNNPGDDSLLCEVDGLEHLRRALSYAGITDIGIPQIIQSSKSTLELTRIRTTPVTPEHSQALACGLAALHNTPLLNQQSEPEESKKRFGFYSNNWIGRNRQINPRSESWGDFFIANRLEFQVSLIESHAIRYDFSQCLEKHRSKLKRFLDSECSHSSLLHGDLWQGNVLFAQQNKVYLIDPAVYFGDSEADIAMTELFGGFPELFYTHYREYKPLSANYPIKKVIYNLYHLLNHYNLFGSSYLSDCEYGFSCIENL